MSSGQGPKRCQLSQTCVRLKKFEKNQKLSGMKYVLCRPLNDRASFNLWHPHRQPNVGQLTVTICIGMFSVHGISPFCCKSFPTRYTHQHTNNRTQHSLENPCHHSGITISKQTIFYQTTATTATTTTTATITWLQHWKGGGVNQLHIPRHRCIIGHCWLYPSHRQHVMAASVRGV